MVIELFDDIAPVAVQHFKNRCSGAAREQGCWRRPRRLPVTRYSPMRCLVLLLGSRRAELSTRPHPTLPGPRSPLRAACCWCRGRQRHLQGHRHPPRGEGHGCLWGQVQEVRGAHTVCCVHDNHAVLGRVQATRIVQGTCAGGGVLSRQALRMRIASCMPGRCSRLALLVLLRVE